MDNRSTPRLDLALECALGPTDGDGSGISGTTINISRTGALVRCLHWEGELPLAGDVLDIKLALAANGVGHRRCIRGQASVVRTSLDEGGAPLLALKFGKIEFGIWQEERLSLVC